MGAYSVVTMGLFLVIAVNAAPSKKISLFSTVDCSIPENQVILHPHPTNCSQYLQCNHGTPLERPCAEGTEFSPSIGVCVHPWQSDCTAEDQSEPDEELEDDDEEAEVPEIEPTTPDALEEEDEVGVTVLADEVLEEIPEEGPSLPLGDEPAEEEEPAPVEPQDQGEDGDASDALEREDEEREVISPEVTCQSKSDTFFLAEYPQDCTAYVICNFGSAVLRSCSDGEYFNPSISTCTTDNSHCA